ncbi:DUF305 domain-containing protein [Agromyces ramosus]|uniref:Uncharacterized protein (DUF305 family) n=1 Tax=Agromyces ramosus TaxID=33879 RepID=A0ABU0R6I7_9MICO|nr:DUF305 domain-containing protein [Agromyces ramosus]MDQ0893689.1 uncharacterized protein (DUF305 family) [Agromyces ramosus]
MNPRHDRRPRRGRRGALAGVGLGLVVGVLALAGCAANPPGGSHDAHDTSSAESDSAASTAGANEADVMFAQMMLPHHEQALEMSGIVLAKAGLDPEVAALAEQIEAAQGPEIQQLEAWLEEWDAPREAPGEAHGMEGILSEDEIAELEAADAASASTLFLEQMIGHHEGAIAMAEEHLDDGAHEGALAMSEAIIASQTAEIAQMRELLAG